MPAALGEGPIAHARRTTATVLEWILFIFCVVLLVGLFLVIIVAVFSRAFGESLAWYDEVASNGLAWLTFYGSAFAALKGAHLNFDAVFGALPRQARVCAFFLSKAITISFFGAMAYAGTYLLGVFGDETLTSLKWVPLALTQSALPVGAALFIIAELLLLPDGLREAQAGRVTSHEPVEPLA